ncbi:sialic acid-binding Ig-like lectin 10 [Saccopteryx bilineata]|uniref:sialic acid-binding Ig-like lectin 10 n=1 Tax=Saccopteryx bilineata TaxID=59482 RepID=UPI00338F8CA4
MLLTLLLAVLRGGEWAEGGTGRGGDRTRQQGQDSGFSLTVQKVVTVPQGLCVLVPCSVSYPQEGWTQGTPAHGYWFKDGTKTTSGYPVATNDRSRTVALWAQNRFQLAGSPRDGSCSLLITDVQMGDSTTYHFRIERGPNVKYNFVENKLRLNVTARTQKPAVYIPETLEAGSQVTAICVFAFDFALCEAPTFSWMGAAVPYQEIRPSISHVSVLTLTPSPQDHGTDLTCRVDFPRTTVHIESSVRLNVAYAPKVPVISISRDNRSAPEFQGDSPHLEAQKGQFLQMLCVADSRPPATLSWALEDRVLSWSRPSGSGGLELVLPRVLPGDAGCYTCLAQNRLGFQSGTLTLTVQYAPENLRVMISRANGTVLENLGNGRSLPVLEGQSLRLLCVADGNPPAELSWFLRGQILKPSQPSAPGVLELPRIQREHEGEFTCQAQNVRGKVQFSLSLSVHYPPQLLGPSCSWEDQGLHCSCSSRAQPAPSLRWRLGAGLLEGNHSNVSCTITSRSAGPWANSSLSLSQELSAGLRLSCEASNVHGAQSAAVLLLPEKKELISKGFSKGIVLGTGITTLLFICLILIIVKTLRKKQTQNPTEAETQRPRVTRRSTILDYINMVPNSGGLGRNRKVKPSSPSGASSADANSPGPKLSPPAPESRNNQEEMHYAALSFPGLKPKKTREFKDTSSEYAEIRFH